MATKTILNNVVIRDKESLMKLLLALERSDSRKAKKVKYSRAITVMTPEQMDSIFLKTNDGL